MMVVSGMRFSTETNGEGSEAARINGTIRPKSGLWIQRCQANCSVRPPWEYEQRGIGPKGRCPKRNAAHLHERTTGSEAIESSTKLPTEPTTSLIEKTDSTRDERAAELVDRLSLWSGAAGLIPVPLVDVAAVWGVQLHMLRRLSEIYGVPFSENRGKSILTSLAGAMIPATAATTMTSLMKGVPIVGTAIGALTMPAVGAGATWIIGKVFIKHFTSGGTLLDFNPPNYREFLKTQRAKLADRSNRR